MLIPLASLCGVRASYMLSALGYRVIEVSGGKEGNEIYRTKQDEIDLIIIDMIMPVMTGAETIEILGRMDSNVKIIISSGFHNKDGSIKNNSRVMGYLQKHFRMNELSTLIQSVLGKD